MNNQKRVSEIITIEEIKKWTCKDIITISAGTGVGKSYFIKNILYAFAKQKNKKILYLIHRRNCIDQFQKEINKDNKSDIINIISYQKLETYWKNNKNFDFNEYQYIVNDEFHYFLGDSQYNHFSDISLNIILNQTNKIKIFMSATGNSMKKYINEHKKLKTKDYNIPIKFNFIKELIFFHKDKTIEEFIKECINSKKKDKCIFFIQSADKAYKLYQKYKKYCVFNCGKSDKHYKYVDIKKIDQILIKCKFEEKILITTTCMDSGVNILDSQVKHIICDIKDIDVLIQCIGRKRQINNTDKSYIYIKTISNKQLGGIKSQIYKKMNMAKYFKENGLQQFIDKYPRESDNTSMLYDIQINENDKCSKQINELMYFKCQLDIEKINDMLEYGKFGYCNYLIKLFNYKNKNNKEKYILLDENYEIDLKDYLNSIIGLKLFTNEKKELIDKINLRDNKNRQQKSISLLNAYLKENKLPYIIDNQIDNKRKINNNNNPNYKKSYWIIGKIDYKK